MSQHITLISREASRLVAVPPESSGTFLPKVGSALGPMPSVALISRFKSRMRVMGSCCGWCLWIVYLFNCWSLMVNWRLLMDSMLMDSMYIYVYIFNWWLLMVMHSVVIDDDWWFLMVILDDYWLSISIVNVFIRLLLISIYQLWTFSMGDYWLSPSQKNALVRTMIIRDSIMSAFTWTHRCLLVVSLPLIRNNRKTVSIQLVWHISVGSSILIHVYHCLLISLFLILITTTNCRQVSNTNIHDCNNITNDDKIIFL